MKEGCVRQNGMKLSLLTSRASVCNTTVVRFESGGTVLSSCVMHRHTGPAPFIMGLATAIVQQDNVRPHVARIVQWFFVNHEIELLPWPAPSPDFCSIENMWVHGCSMIDPDYIPSCCLSRSTLAMCGSCLHPKNTSKVSLNQGRGVWQR
ncbi:transposable element Tcb1 transposase [Trichonephila clavipes]|nr:transposable element Tcb1 transposase [Trichonephila clavipes]